ncbi:hypothetical protein M406DRAFT_355343 [Cryphonectria parasitica EP155]|uniref:Uncharacterized protein n=1 Tax=Cryphonectria parasitica (strain ATCC 38755 / EP155) TaxID=660469 RepID=A0A9P4Y595_CRYP1|nr:uncharacterized protein M406DRAFT_355343 [Cryphonectria parasitica EP155]KAF3766751.1 hypothetical protein M406DRAFT_355343 [Cryphonectria parasitica EP155]
MTGQQLHCTTHETDEIPMAGATLALPRDDFANGLSKGKETACYDLGDRLACSDMSGISTSFFPGLSGH